MGQREETKQKVLIPYHLNSYITLSYSNLGWAESSLLNLATKHKKKVSQAESHSLVNVFLPSSMTSRELPDLVGRFKKLR